MRKAILIAALLLASCSPPDITTGDTRLVGAYAIDGDTFRLGEARYRLARIDAPEMPGHCRPGRHCAQGDPYAAQRALQWYLDQPEALCRAIGLDVYNRVLVECHAGALSINDELIALGVAQEYRHD